MNRQMMVMLSCRVVECVMMWKSNCCQRKYHQRRDNDLFVTDRKNLYLCIFLFRVKYIAQNSVAFDSLI